MLVGTTDLRVNGWDEIMQNEERAVAVTDGEAIHIGEGNWMTFQTDEYGKVHSTLMSVEDMRRLIDATP